MKLYLSISRRISISCCHKHKYNLLQSKFFENKTTFDSHDIISVAQKHTNYTDGDGNGSGLQPSDTHRHNDGHDMSNDDGVDGHFFLNLNIMISRKDPCPGLI